MYKYDLIYASHVPEYLNEEGRFQLPDCLA